LICKKGEEGLVTGLISECEKDFSALMMEQTGREYKTKLTLITDRFMTEQ
jgi:hypothetical protein